jgi:metal-responsive CopG/Arc/MetJ family transcriptional regulator
MPRTIVDLPSSQLRDLDSRCRSEGISRAEGVRRAVQSYLREAQGDSEQGFGLWKDGSAKGRRNQGEGEA